MRIHTSRFLSALLLGLVLTATPACASSSRRVYVRGAPPAPIVDVRGVAPARGYVWVAGYHQWNGRGYTWIPGRWVAPPSLVPYP